MIHIEGYITMDTIVAEALENEGKRVSILRRMQISVESMVRRSRYAHQAHPPRQQIIYTQRVKHPQDEIGPSQPDTIARWTGHRENEEAAGPSHSQSDSQTAPTRRCG